MFCIMHIYSMAAFTILVKILDVPLADRNILVPVYKIFERF